MEASFLPAQPKISITHAPTSSRKTGVWGAQSEKKAPTWDAKDKNDYPFPKGVNLSHNTYIFFILRLFYYLSPSFCKCVKNNVSINCWNMPKSNFPENMVETLNGHILLWTSRMGTNIGCSAFSDRPPTWCKTKHPPFFFGGGASMTKFSNFICWYFSTSAPRGLLWIFSI